MKAKTQVQIWLCLAICLATPFTHAQTLVGNTITSTDTLDGTGDAVAISDDGNRIIVGTTYNPRYYSDSIGHAKVYQLNGNIWEQLGQDVREEKPDDEFGVSVCISSDGNRIGVGGSLGVVVYELAGLVWEQVGNRLILPGMDTLSSDIEDIRFSVDGNTVAISGYSAEADIIVYEFSGNSWTPKGNIFSSDVIREFGLSADGNRIVVYADDPLQRFGKEVRAFEFQSGVWNLLGDAIKLPMGYGYAEGIDIAGNGNRIVVSLVDANWSDTGAIATYDLVGNDWVQNDSLLSLVVLTTYGASLRLSHDGNTFVFGNSTDQSVIDETTVVVYQYVNQAWQLLGDTLQGAAHDETATGHVDITSDGSRIVMGGIKVDSNDFRGFSKVYDFMNLNTVDDHQHTQGVTVFPNPTTGIVTVFSDKPPFILSISDLTGKVLETIKSQQSRCELDISTYSNGMYLIYHKSENGKTNSFQKISLIH